MIGQVVARTEQYRRPVKGAMYKRHPVRGAPDRPCAAPLPGCTERVDVILRQRQLWRPVEGGGSGLDPSQANDEYFERADPLPKGRPAPNQVSMKRRDLVGRRQNPTMIEVICPHRGATIGAGRSVCPTRHFTELTLIFLRAVRDVWRESSHRDERDAARESVSLVRRDDRAVRSRACNTR